MAYDVQTVAAIMEMASLDAKSRLIASAIQKRDYPFLNAVHATSGMVHLNGIAKSGDGLLMSSSRNPLEMAVLDGDENLFDWFFQKDVEVNGNWVGDMQAKPYPTLNFPALADAFSLGHENLARRLLRAVAEEPDCNFVFSNNDQQREFVLHDPLDVNKPGGITPLACALSNGWDQLAGELLKDTRQTFEYDLMVAIHRGSPHVDAVAAKIESIEFSSMMRRNSSVFKKLDSAQKNVLYDALIRHAPLMKFGSVASQSMFSNAIESTATADDARFYLEYPGLAAEFKSRNIDVSHSILGAAVLSANLEVAQWLVEERGVDPSGVKFQNPSMSSQYVPPIFLATGPVLDYLAKMGADVNAEDPVRRTPLFDAVKNDDLARVEKLIMLGADTGLKVDGRSVLQVAKSDGVRRLIRSARTMAAVSEVMKNPGAQASSETKKSVLPL